MSEVLKRRFNIGVGKETTRGTLIAPTAWLKPNSENVEDKVEVQVSERAFGRIEDSEDQQITKKFAEGSISGEIMDTSIGLFLLGAIGEVASVESADTGVYDHTFSLLQSSQHPSLSVEVKRGDNEQLGYANCVVSSLKIDAVLNDYVKYEVAIRGKKGVSASATPAYTEENVFMGKDISVKLADDLAGLDGASVINARSISLTITKNTEDNDVLGSDTPDDFFNKQFAVEGNLEVLMSDMTYKDYLRNGTAKAMRLSMVNGDVTIGASSNPELQIDLAKVKFSEAVETGDNNEMVKMAMSFKAFYSPSDSQMIEAVLKNEATSY